MIRSTRFLTSLVFVLALNVSFGHAQQQQAAPSSMKLPSIISDHMVLQNGVPAPVWGWATPGTTVRVEFLDTKDKTLVAAHAVADSSGKWSAKLPQLASGISGELQITAGAEPPVIVHDVLVGEVWLCGGQSNMEFSMARVLDAKTEIAAANDPQLRVFLVAHHVALIPLDDVQGQWALCTPQSITPFSAVGYYFGKQLRTALNQPVGLIGSYWGGTSAQVWMSADSLQKTPGLESYTNSYKAALAAYPKGEADYESQQAAALAAQQKWRTDINYDAGYTAAMTAWRAAAARATEAHQPQPPQPKPPIPEPHMPPGALGTPSVLYNGMIAPLVPYTLKGAIWFQADGNMGHPDDYGLLIQTLIKDWRAQWGAVLPFYYVEMNNMRDNPQVNPVQYNNLCLIREEQEAALELAATDVACSIDVGLPIPEPHFPNKKPVGQRLALLALNNLYGYPCEAHSPQYASFAVEGNKIRVQFKYADGLRVRDGGKMVGFAIRGATGDWVWADGQIKGNEILLSNDQVPQPVAVRYAWAANPLVSVENGAGLPLRPFRTDRTSPQ